MAYNSEDAPKIPDAWLNDSSSYQRCFVCGQQNIAGLQLVFTSDGNKILADFTLDERFQGFPGVAHGGILAAILDETLGRVTVPERRWVMTAKLDLRYRRPAPIHVPLRVYAEAVDARERLVRAKGYILAVGAEKTVFCEAEGLFMPLPETVRKQAVTQWPGLEDFFPAQLEETE